MIYKDKVAFFASYISDMEYKGIKAKTLETVDFTRLQGITTVFLIMYRYIQIKFNFNGDSLPLSAKR